VVTKPNNNQMTGETTVSAEVHTALPPWKRILDLALILFLSPGVLLVGVVAAMLVKLGSRGPLLFRQERVGY
jgi:lipopolysaccharide/colanic/teichoic acid biosynthesis glycosyltransferase